MSGSTTFLEATGLSLGLFADAGYEVRKAVLNPGETLLLFTDGLTDSIQGENPENRVRDAFAESADRMIANLKSLVDPRFTEDDVTMLLVKRIAGVAHNGVSARQIQLSVGQEFALSKIRMFCAKVKEFLSQRRGKRETRG